MSFLPRCAISTGQTPLIVSGLTVVATATIVGVFLESAVVAVAWVAAVLLAAAPVVVAARPQAIIQVLSTIDPTTENTSNKIEDGRAAGSANQQTACYEYDEYDTYLLDLMVSEGGPPGLME